MFSSTLIFVLATYIKIAVQIQEFVADTNLVRSLVPWILKL